MVYHILALLEQSIFNTEITSKMSKPKGLTKTISSQEKTTKF